VPAGRIRELIVSATWAPSAHNRQPWRFAALEDRTKMERLARAMADRLRQDRLADGDEPGVVEADARRSQSRITGAAWVVVVCLDRSCLDPYPDPRRQAAEHTMAVQSVAMAGHGLMLAAFAAGLASCWICAPLFAPQEVHRVLDLPAGWEPQGAVLLGRPLGATEPRTRETVDAVARFL
jgi:F420 biosynthesis protein FbiB-like protein